MLGAEQIYNPTLSLVEKAYIALFGMPIVGLRIRARNVLYLIPQDRTYHRILDAGSGPGVFAFELGRRFPGARVLGIDILDDSVLICRRIAERIRSEALEFRREPIEAMSEKDAFDLILCVDLLEHIEDDWKALKSLFSAASPGGVLVVHVPALYRRYPVFSKHLNFEVETHVRIGYLPEEIRERVEEAGFAVREIGYTYGFWETLANNLSFMITHARMKNKLLYALAFPFLNALSLLGARARPKQLGAGLYVVAVKGELR